MSHVADSNSKSLRLSAENASILIKVTGPLVAPPIVF